MNIVFLMDPLNVILVETDSTYLFMLSAHKRGHKVFYLGEGAMSREEGKTLFHVTEVIPQEDYKNPFIVKAELILNENEVDVIWIRTDPPFDSQYLFNTWILDLLDPKILILNRPSGIRTVNEKIWSSQFTSIVPITLITRDKQEMQNFLNVHIDIIVKPLNGHGGKGVFRLRLGDTNLNVTLEHLSKGFSEEIILQQFVEDASKGDKRIILLNGEPLGAMLRLHSEDDHRNNIIAGGTAYATEITERDKEIISTLKPHLQALGLYFVGIDVIGDYLIEVNVTSPTGLKEMNDLYDVHLEDAVTAFVEQLVLKKAK
jgi:glutathione synthase